MAGEVVTRKFTFLNGPIGSPDVTNIFPEADKDCCYMLTALASPNPSDTRGLINDFHRYHRPFQKSTTGVEMFLTKPFDSSFVEQPLNDNTHGLFFELGYFVDGQNRNYISYQLDWRLIYNLIGYGAGTYQIKIISTLIVGAPETTYDIPFCLKAYTPELANGTIRFTTQMTGTIADRYDLSNTISFPENFENQIRVEGNFGGGNNDEIEIKSTKWNDLSLNDYENKVTPIFAMFIDPTLEYVHEFIRNDVRQANRVSVTDYNKNNPNHHDETQIGEPTAYENEPLPNALKSSARCDWRLRHDTGTKDFCLP